MFKNKDERVLRLLIEKGMVDESDGLEIIERYCEDDNKKEQEIRELEKRAVEELGANRIRLHFDETMVHLSSIEKLFDEEGNILESEMDSEHCKGFLQLVKYVEDIERDGLKAEISLGPGVPHPERTPDRRHMYSITEYELPVDDVDKKVWEKYCRGIAHYFPNSDLTVWIEPNYKGFVQGGRDGCKYGDTVISAAQAVREIYPEKKVGLNMLFLDQEFIFQTLDHIKEKGISPADIVGYITFNPYRFHAPESPTCPEKSSKLDLGNKPVEVYDSYEQEVQSFRKKLLEYGITDIRVGESGFEGDNYTPHQNAVCNLRSWALNRYLSVRETPWRAVQKKGSGSNRGLISEEGIPTENFNAYKHFNEIFTPDVKPIGEIVDPQDRRVYCKIFKNEKTNEDIIVLWVAQEYDSKQEIYQRTFIINTPRNEGFTEISKLWDKEVGKETMPKDTLNKQGIIVTEDPVILIGNFGF